MSTYVASNGIHTAVIQRDQLPMNPRDPSVAENLGTMICWDKKYNLGDRHSFDTARDLFQHLASEYISATDLFQVVQAGKLEHYRLQERPHAETNSQFCLQTYCDIPGMEGWVDTDWLADQDLRLLSSGEEDLTDLLECFHTNELFQLLENSNKLVILPLHLYEHDDLSLRIGSNQGRAHHADWDSRKVGYIYTDEDLALNAIRSEIGGNRESSIFSGQDPTATQHWKTFAAEQLAHEVTLYDNYLKGDIYCVKFYEGCRHVNSQYDINPAGKNIEDSFEDLMEKWHPELAAQLKPYPEEVFHIEDYLQEQEFPAYRRSLHREVAFLLHSQSSPYPFAKAPEEILSNKDDTMDRIVQTLYEKHTVPTCKDVFYAIADIVGFSREVLPRITASDLDPEKDYTNDDLLQILREKKTPLMQIIAEAEAKRDTTVSENRPYPDLDH